MEELLEWLKANKMTGEQLESDVLMIEGLGKVLFEDTSELNSIFRINKDGQPEFNLLENEDVLMREDIQHVAFKFGDNWYYYKLQDGFGLNILKYVAQAVPSKCQTPIVNLGVHTGFELLNGSFMPKDWVRKAKFLGQTAIGICDMNTMAGCYQLQKECEAAGITPVFGYSFQVYDQDTSDTLDMKIYVQTQEGLQRMLRLQKAIMVDSENKCLDLEKLWDFGPGNVLVLGKKTPASWIKNSFIKNLPFEGIYYQVDLSEYKAERIDKSLLDAQAAYFHEIYPDIKPILLTDSYYLDKSDYRNKIILNKVATGAAHEQSDDQYFKDADEHLAPFLQLFGDDWDIQKIFDECAANAVHVAEKAEARFENTRNFMPKYDMTPEEKAKYGTTANMFDCLLEEGLNRLIPEEKREEYRKQMEYEKYIIKSTDNVDYLLVQYDTCNWARRNNILVGCGRGSAAGSLLLYLLGITLIDPIKYDLIFERFLLPERAGLYPADTTIIGEDIESSAYVEITLENGQVLKIDKDAQLEVMRDGSDESIAVYADELKEGDDILFDNHDLLFTLPTL